MGFSAVHKFRGMFAFALWDIKDKKLILCRDRIGVKPLYYYYKDGVFTYASEL
jgi:asparagine synthase (glutamine-hydrolysing)